MPTKRQGTIEVPAPAHMPGDPLIAPPIDRPIAPEPAPIAPDDRDWWPVPPQGEPVG